MEDKLTNHIITIKIPDGKEGFEKYDVKLRKPGFEDYVGAVTAANLPSGNYSVLHQGKFILDTCVVEPLPDKIKNDANAMGSLAIEAAKLIKLYDAELKKK